MADGRRVTVGTTPTRLNTTDDRSDNRVGEEVLLTNTTGTTVDVGGSGVAAGSGYRLLGGASMGFPLSGDGVFGVVASGSVIVDVFEVGV